MGFGKDDEICIITFETSGRKTSNNQLCIQPISSTGFSFKLKPAVLKVHACVSYHLVGGVVRLELLMGRVLHVDWVVSDDRGDRGVVAHHRLCTLFAVQLQECLQGRSQQYIQSDSPITYDKARPTFIL